MARILLVDDDEDFLLLMSEYLESIGLEYDLAVSAEQARNRLEHSGYDIVVSDFNMPGESGLDLLRHVSSRYPEIQFVLLTGYDDPRVRREALRMGVHAYIQKPFYMNELWPPIINLLRRNDQEGFKPPGPSSSPVAATCP